MTQGAVKPPRGESEAIEAPKPATWGTKKPVVIKDWGAGHGSPGVQRLFLAGTTLDCPIQTATVRHVAFTRFSGGNPVFHDNAGQKQTLNDARKNGAHRWGGYAHLNEAQYDAVLRDIFDESLVKGGPMENGVVKWLRKVNDDPTGSNWRIMSRYSPSWGAKGQQPGDIPLGFFLYLVPVDELDYQAAETASHPTLIARPEGFTI